MEFESMVRSALLRLKWIDSHKYSEHVLWGAAADLFGIGSTSAHELCRHFGLDPNERLPESSLAKAAVGCMAEMDDEEQGADETCCKMMSRIEDAARRD